MQRVRAAVPAIPDAWCAGMLRWAVQVVTWPCGLLRVAVHERAVVITPEAPLLLELGLREIASQVDAGDNEDDGDDRRGDCDELPLPLLEVIRVLSGHVLSP